MTWRIRQSRAENEGSTVCDIMPPDSNLTGQWSHQRETDGERGRTFPKFTIRKYEEERSRAAEIPSIRQQKPNQIWALNRIKLVRQAGAKFY